MNTQFPNFMHNFQVEVGLVFKTNESAVNYWLLFRYTSIIFFWFKLENMCFDLKQLLNKKGKDVWFTVDPSNTMHR